MNSVFRFSRRFCFFASLLACGCSNNPPPSLPHQASQNEAGAGRLGNSTVEIARSQWTRAWAHRVIGRAYDEYLEAKDKPTRERKHAEVMLGLELAVGRQRISGSQLLDLLGPPSLWADDNGDTRLIYFFQVNKVQRELIVDIDEVGEVRMIGSNNAGINKWGPSYHH